MGRLRSRKIAVHVEVVSIPLAQGGPMQLPCLECNAAIEIHQPDADAPDDLLGTCPECGSWHMVAIEPDGAAVMVARLPRAAVLGCAPAIPKVHKVARL